MILSIYNYENYKDYLRDRIRTAEPSRGLVSKLAKKAGCQSSYLSQVLNGHVHLLPDHALGISHFLELSPSECDYFLLLVDEGRAATPLLKNHLKQKRSELKVENREIGKRLQRKESEITDFHLQYYSSWLWMTVHILTSIPDYQNVKAISARLGIATEELTPILEKLRDAGFIRKEKDHWVHSGSEQHLSRQSSLIHLHHNNWRQRAVLDSQLNFQGESLHFSGVYAVSKKDVEELKSLLLKTIENFNQRAGPSPSEEAICFNCDYFRL